MLPNLTVFDSNSLYSITNLCCQSGNSSNFILYPIFKIQTNSGWGGKTRTYEWRDQNPLPYHLATPQFLAGTKGFEPLQNDLESFVLPLHQVPKILTIIILFKGPSIVLRHF